MRNRELGQRIRRRGWAVAALAALLALNGCKLDQVEIPDLAGPASFGLSLILTVTPDVLIADSVSTASVQATLRGPDGRPVGGRAVVFSVTDEQGRLIDLGSLFSTSAAFPTHGPQVQEITGGNGVAQVIYRVPERIVVTAQQDILIEARLVGNDAQGQQPKHATLELRPAEVRRFPEAPGNTAPNCNFFIDPEIGPNGGKYPVNFTIRMKSTASDPDAGDFIVRYFWDFGDGTQDDKPEVQKHYTLPGTYTVIHVVTDNHGAQSSCFLAIAVGS